MSVRFGAFGKVPALGDFFNFGLNRGFIDAWDSWLQQGLLAARAELGPDWNECYNSAPLWRFTLPPKVAGSDSVLGVLTPSVDRVGRQFPLTLVGALPAGTRPLAAHLRCAGLFERLEDIALDALESGLDRAALEARLADMPAGSGWDRAETGQKGRLYRALRGDEVGAMPDLAASLLEAAAPKMGYWSARLDGESRSLAVDGLPAATAMRTLFDVGAPTWAVEA
ncbi:MAG: type VI secretion system-associated protein TagF [Pseudomonadota bacterium]